VTAATSSLLQTRARRAMPRSSQTNTEESNYHIETTIDLSCIENVPVI
jgi:hypothetical protein